MRLTCPNCGAEYEPPRNMVPSGGRHVQCSACHTRWFAKAESPPQLTEEQIIKRLGSRTPNLRVVEEPVAAPWAGPNADEAAPETAPAAGTGAAAPATDTGEEDFAWESAATEPRAASAFAEASTAFGPAKPAGDAEATEFAWTEPGAAEAPKAGAPMTAAPVTAAPAAETPPPEAAQPPAPEEAARPAAPEATEPPAPAPSETAAAQSPESAEAPLRVRPPKPVIIIEETRSNTRFWLGFGSAIAVFLVLLVLYFATRAVAAEVPVAGAYAGLVDGLRQGVANLLSLAG